MPLTEVIIYILLPLSGIHIALLITALVKLGKLEVMQSDIERRINRLEETTR